MEPNRLENEFKKKLEGRNIKPSDMAWDRLDAMLTVAEKKKQKPKRTWMYVAASFLGFILIATVFISQNDSDMPIETNNNTIVETPKAEPDNNLTEPAQLPQVIDDAPVMHKKQEAVARIETPSHKTEAPVQQQKTEMIKSNEPFMQKMQQEAVVNNNNINIEKRISADEEAERLLSASLGNRVKKKSNVKVSSNSLLTNVEGELNESFRDKVLQSVNKNYNAVKTSLANRNRE
jgi:hypothetical protein